MDERKKLKGEREDDVDPPHGEMTQKLSSSYYMSYIELTFEGMERECSDDAAPRCVTDDEAVTNALHSLHTWLPSS